MSVEKLDMLCSTIKIYCKIFESTLCFSCFKDDAVKVFGMNFNGGVFMKPGKFNGKCKL